MTAKTSSMDRSEVLRSRCLNLAKDCSLGLLLGRLLFRNSATEMNSAACSPTVSSRLKGLPHIRAVVDDNERICHSLMLQCRRQAK
jgi:hypothetical protein